MPHQPAPFGSTTSGYDWISRSLRLAIYLRDFCRCVRCGAAQGDPDNPMTLDHVDPDGPSRAENLVTLCHACNSLRRATPIAEFDASYAESARAAVARPLDRAAARAWAKKLWPQRFEQQAKAQRELRARRRVRRAA